MAEPAPAITPGQLLERLLTGSGEGRLILAIAGAPGSGKSTLAEHLVAEVNTRRPGHATLLPMDGYHFDDLVLEDLGRQARKGAPDTFDVGGLAHMLGRLRSRDETSVALPVFDRSIEIARAGARLIDRSAGLVVVEGNYLLLDSPPWNTLVPFFDLTVMIEVDEATLRDRLTRRWQGFGLTPAEVGTKLEANDLPNGRLVRDKSRRPDFRLLAPGF